MASWVINIARNFSQHWDYLRRDEVWDMPKRYKIRQGDFVYFRISGGPILGQTVATSDARPLVSSDDVPWTNGRDPYTTRFELRMISDQPLSNPSWSSISARLSKSPPLMAPRSWTSPGDEAVFASLFGGRELTPEESLDDEKRAKILADLSKDERIRARQMIALRQGQSGFRKALLSAYSVTCAVTGTATERVLEAAHIAPYKGAHTNQTSNGLLLRADIHTLFDLHLLTITPDHVVRVAADVDDAEYARLNGRELACLPGTLTDLPDGQQLAEHNAKCAWLSR